MSTHEYLTEGERLLVTSSFSQSEVARLTKRPRQRVNDWARGKCRPTPEDRAALETAIGVPARAWDAPPLQKVPTPAPKPANAAVEPVAPLDGALELPEDLAGLGLPALERLIRRYRALEPTLPPKERISALGAEARVLVAHETLRQRAADARGEYLTSSAFLDEVRALLAVTPGPAAALRAHLARLGIALPPPPTTTAPALEPPATSADIDDLVAELITAEGFRDAGEPGLAVAHTLGLALDVHATAIANLVIDDAARATRLLSLVDGPEEAAIRAAIELGMAVRDAAALPGAARSVVANLLRALGHTDIANHVGEAP